MDSYADTVGMNLPYSLPLMPQNANSLPCIFKILVSKNSYLGKIKVSISVGIAGGKRGKTRLQNPLSVICNLINLASLASTKAKMNENKLKVEDFVDIESIA
jgi:hypothetical protein